MLLCLSMTRRKRPSIARQIVLYTGLFAFAIGLGVLLFFGISKIGANTHHYKPPTTTSTSTPKATTTPVIPPTSQPTWPKPLDKEEYDERLLSLAHYTPPTPITATTTNPDGTISTTTKTISDLVHASGTNVTVDGALYPPAAPYPHGGAILPFQRIIAYYGNLYSTRMGILGEYEPEEVLAHLRDNVKAWEAADPNTPVMPAIHYIAMVAQADAGADGMYRAMMPDSEIEKAYNMAQEIDGILFLDLQVGLSTIERELPKIKAFLERPDVHLGIDPEFSMKSGDPPGTVIGTYDAKDINYVINYLSDIVREHELPPKVLVIHRFTQKMVTKYQDIRPTPEVQVVMHMDGWGSRPKKRGTYNHILAPEPVQFTGVKIFYKNDLKPPSTGIFTPDEVLELDPKPIYIQYQ